jgi:hypothetical protein
MCCASSEIERCVIVMVQLYCWVFTFVVFVGKGCLALVPAHLPHLRLLRLESCERVRNKYISKLVAALPELAIINCQGKIFGELRNKQLEAVCSKLAPDCERITKKVYAIIRQWALDR